MKYLVMTLGLPRSGKSTWARQQGYPIVNPDSIRLALHGEAFIKNAEPMVWTVARYMVESLFLAGHDVVILDSCNQTERRRNDWRSKKWKRLFKVFDTDIEECKRRAVESNQEYLIPVIDRMKKDYDPVEEHNIERILKDIV
jgi:predicted kinase